jgi:hypothetical protein
MTDKIDSDELLSEVTGTCVAGRVLRAARLITRHYDDALRPTGLTITQFGYAACDRPVRAGLHFPRG